MTGSGHVEIFQDRNLEWRWRRKAGNGKIVATSGEGYLHRIDCLAQVAELFPAVMVATVELKTLPPEPTPAPEG